MLHSVPALLPHLLKGIGQFNVGNLFCILELEKAIPSVTCTCKNESVHERLFLLSPIKLPLVPSMWHSLCTVLCPQYKVLTQVLSCVHSTQCSFCTVLCPQYTAFTLCCPVSPIYCIHSVLPLVPSMWHSLCTVQCPQYKVLTQVLP